MAKYRFDPDGLYKDYPPERTVWVLDLVNAELRSGDEFDPAEYGLPDWKPEPYPHPLFLDLSAPAPAPGPLAKADESTAATDDIEEGS